MLQRREVLRDSGLRDVEPRREILTAASPRVSDTKIARRLGSASAWKILFSAATALLMDNT
jgi:hypothetical protein